MPERREQRHRWTVDQIEEDIAAVEHDGDRVHTIPRSLLPPDAREGDVLAVTVARATDGDRTTISVEIDRAATRDALARSRRQRARRPKQDDPGGDITL